MSINLDALVPAWYAAQHAQISRQTLNYWIKTGKVRPAVDHNGTLVTNQQGHKLYRLRDVLTVEAQLLTSKYSHRGVPRPRTGPTSWAAVNQQTAAV